MESVSAELAKPFVERLINGAIAESRYICCFTRIAEEFEQEKVGLEAERKTVGQHVEVATGRGEDIQGSALYWKEEADKLIQEDTKAKQKCFFGLCPHCIWRYRRGKELAKKTEQIKRLKGERVENVGLPAPLPGVERYSSQYYISFKSRELKYTELLDALKDDNNYITGLQGMGGTGKTTLAKEVGKQLKQSEQFVHVVDTTVSFTPDIKKIQDDIAGPLGLTLGDCNESDRPKKLWSRLTNGEKILLVLDDVWGDINFDEIGIPYSDNHKGCRILITTRNLWVCNKMGCGRTIQLQLLTKEDAWVMFKRHAGLSDISSKSLLDKGHKIANECKGLPVAIAVIASSLKGQQRREEWDMALNSLQKSVSLHGVDGDLVGIYKCLKFSYDYLKEEEAKGLFLLCSVFPEDEEISIEILTRLGIGAGLFGEDYGSYDDARKQVVVAKNKLLDSCLLLDAGEGCIKMHDLVRDAAQWIAKKEIRTVNLSHKDQKSLVEREKNIKYLLCEGKVMDVFFSRFSDFKLEILIAILDVDKDHNCVKVPNSLFENIAGLRALHLNNKNKWFYSYRLALSLPQSIQSLTSIRSLLVDGVDLGDISVLGNLQSLETIDLVRCKINELPHEITKLEKLRLLKLEDCEVRRNNPFEVIRRCSSLEELYFEDSFNSFCQEITFPKLQRYHVYRRLGCAIMNKSLSRCVAFDGYGDVGFLSEATFKDCMQTVEILHLHRIKGGWRNFIPEIVPIDERMTDLVELGLHGISQLQRLIDTIDSNVRNVLSKLVVLKLRDMENLEELCNGPLSFDSLESLENLKIGNCQHFRSLFKCSLNLCNLKTMSLRKCPMMVSLFQLSTSQSLVQLEKLIIADCEQLEKIIIDESEKEESREEIVDGGNDNKSCGSMFPRLKVLDIDKCPRLEFLFWFPSARDFSVLETIITAKCDKLKCIFGQYVQLGSLKEIHLRDLPNFIDIFPERYHPMSSSVKGSSSTSSDGFKEQTQLDPIKYTKKSWTNICCYGHKYRHKSRSATSTKLPYVSEGEPHDFSITSERVQCLLRQSQIMCNIKEIELSRLSKIKSVFILSVASKMLLETLTIRNCDELKHIIVDTADDSGGNNWGNVFPKLRQISIKDCMQLEYIFGHYANDHQNHNEIHLYLPALECLNLCNLPSLIAMCPKKYRTTFPSLIAIGDFITHSVSRSLDDTSIKELSGNVEHFLSLERLKVYNSKVENIFFFNEINGQQMNLGLQDIELHDLPMLTYLFVGPKNSFALQNLIEIKIKRCEKLEIIFSTSIIRCLPQLLYLIIEECKELKRIIEDDVESQKMSTVLSSRTCFQKLQVLAIKNCNKLKCVFPVSICKEIPKLKVLTIREADELEEIFESEDDQKWEIPNLYIVVFVNLPSLCQPQGIQFQAVENRFVQNCQKLSLTSAYTLDVFYWMEDLTLGTEVEVMVHLCTLFVQLLQEESKTQDASDEKPSASSQDDGDGELAIRAMCLKLFQQELLEESKTQDTSDEKPSAETTKDFPVGPEVEAVSRGDELTSSQTKTKQTPEAEHGFVENNVPAGLEIPTMAISPTKSEKLMNEQSMGQQCLMNQQHPLDTTVKPSQGNNAGIKRSDEEGITLGNAKTITSSTHPESVNPSSGPLLVTSDQHKPSSQNDGDGQIAIPSTSIATTEPFTNENVETSDPVSLNDDASMKLSSINVEAQFHKDYEISVSGPKPSPCIPSVAASQSPSMPSQGDPSQVVEDLSSFSLVTWELEQLVFKKHLAYETLPLLTDFLVKHPSVRLTNNSLTTRYKGYAYNCLAELLKFLQTHSVLDVLGSSHSEFVELLQDVRICAFDKDWLDGVERRALRPGLEVSQDALQKLLDSKQQATKEVEMLHSKIDILTQHVEDLKHQLASSEAVLEGIIQQEAKVLEERAALCAPLGY